jgi:hypothetical protein
VSHGPDNPYKEQCGCPECMPDASSGGIVNRLTELEKRWRTEYTKYISLNEKTVLRLADELKAAIAAELSDAKKRETPFEAQGKQPATSSAREFVEQILASIETQGYAPTYRQALKGVLELVVAHDADIRAEALREAVDAVWRSFNGNTSAVTEQWLNKLQIAGGGERIEKFARSQCEAILALIPARPENAKPAGT